MQRHEEVSTMSINGNAGTVQLPQPIFAIPPNAAFLLRVRVNSVGSES